MIGTDPFCSLLYFYLPASLVVYGLELARECGRSWSKWRGKVRTDAVMLFCAFMIAYTTVVGCSLEYGENVRFKFPVEPLLWAFIGAVGYRSLRRFRNSRPGRSVSSGMRGSGG